MESTGLDPESLVRAYVALVLWLALALAIAACCMAFLYALFLWAECFSSAQRPVTQHSKTVRLRPSISPRISHRWQSAWRIVGSVLPTRARGAA